MANPPIPTNPNITTGALTGRVVADRYDFQKHIVGEDFRHDGYALSLSPPITINSIEYVDVQSAISQLANLINPPPPPDASPSVKGIIRLSGDLSGTGTTALNPRVSGLQGTPINTLSPTTGQVLTYNGASWGPAAPANTFTAGGDLAGTNLLQEVHSISGSSNTLDMQCQYIIWRSSITNPTLIQDSTNSGAGGNFIISAQNTTQASQNGGGIRLIGGSPGTGGLAGTISLMVDGYQLIQAVNPGIGRRVVGLASESLLNSFQMPANTGDKVIFIAQAATPPTTGVPVGGAILYARSNGLWTKNQDGYDFQLGTSPNPNIWGPTTEQIWAYRNSVNTVSITPNIIFALDLAVRNFVEAIIKVEATVTGIRTDDPSDCAIFNLTRGYYTDGSGAPIAVGSQTLTDTRTSGGASGWAVPAITVLGTSLFVLTGAESATEIKWFAHIRLMVNGLG